MGLTRRALLAGAGAGAGALVVGDVSSLAPARAEEFYGRHQAGVVTPQQRCLLFQTFDATAGSAHALKELLAVWTHQAARCCRGDALGNERRRDRPPADTGETIGLGPARLTITFGLGPSLFDHRYGLAGHRPEALIDLPPFPGDRLEPARCGGDLAVQACSDDPQVAFHAVRDLARTARHMKAARPRWSQAGFDSPPPGATGRNLFGFKDGTNNLRGDDAAMMASNVWVGEADRPAWMRGGTYLVVRRIRQRIERWDESDLDEQEGVFGRRKASGAPFGGRSESDPVDPAREPRHSHVMLANPRLAGSEAERILRRGYGFSDGLLPDGRIDAGLFFAAFQRDPRRQFVPIQRRLAAHDRLNEYVVHTGSAIFAVPPGSGAGGSVGATLFSG